MLKRLFKEHKRWVNYTKKYGGKDYSEDIVQEMYLKVHKYSTEDKVFNNNTINVLYIYIVLRSIIFSHLRNEKRRKELITEPLNIEVSDEILAQHKLAQLIEEEINTWHWYDQQVFRMYRDNKTSFRKMAKDTDISWVSLFNTVKNCKEKLKIKFNEDYQDFINEDYEQIR
jgi:DNA-directed RNA polymerase specialized sigma24 family protein